MSGPPSPHGTPAVSPVAVLDLSKKAPPEAALLALAARHAPDHPNAWIERLRSALVNALSASAHEVLLTLPSVGENSATLRVLRWSGVSGEGDFAILFDESSLRGLEQERDRYEALVDLSFDGFTIFDQNANILFESASNERITGYLREETIGRNLFEFTHPDDQSRLIPRFQALAGRPGGSDSDIVRWRHADGRWLYLEGTVVNQLHDPRIGGMINTFRDVTDRLAMEQELKRAKDAAESAQRLQQHFLANLSHEFRTPLMLIRQPLEDLRPAEPVDERWDIVARNLDRLEGLFSELLDLTRLDAGLFALQARRHALRPLLAGLLAEMSGLAQTRQVALGLEWNAPESLGDGELYLDLPKIAKAILNLLSNALKFSPEGRSVALRVSAATAAEEGTAGSFLLEVLDEGPGVLEADRGRIFDRFYQVAEGDTRPAEGMGIGLALAREMVEMHGGEIGVRPRPGGGSCFWISLPQGVAHLRPDEIDLRAPEAVPRCALPTPTLPAVAEQSTRPSSPAVSDLPTLLLVEDNADLRRYLSLHLVSAFRLQEAQHGREALALIAADPPDVILSDVMMPEMDGIALCRALRTDPATRALPILLLSAKGGADDRAEGLEAGANDYLAKPFLMRELQARLRNLLGGTTAEQPPSDPWATRVQAVLAEHLSEETLSVALLAKHIGLSERQFQRRCLEVFGQSPLQLLRTERVRRAEALLRSGEYETVAETAYAVGLTPNYLSRLFRSELGLRPSEVRPASPSTAAG